MVHANGVRRRVHVGDLQPGDHACLLFGSDEERASILRDFVLGGLDAEDKILYLSAEEDPPGPAALLDRCRLTSVPGGLAGRVEVVRLAEFLSRRGDLEPAALMRWLRGAAQRSREEGYRALRVAGDLGAALRDEHDVRTLLRYETLLAEEFSAGQALAVCQYDIRRCEPAALDAFASAHARSVEADPLVRTADLVVVRTYRPQGLRIEGVIDTDSQRHLRDALRSVAAVRGDVRLEMSRVEFLDLGGLRLLMTFARARAARHCTVELVGLLPHLSQVITLIGWDRTPGLRLGAVHAY
ncbi:anti-anti-sigma regulatory factor [Streptomyces olivoverticillatus]|uniref:Anti-anti-sigma regulatory factor n=1 Tax=Streptomyces olivoverticillatus TaxID=66427 RepID=A0A7W7LJ14_9ACTN|nr:MEDS domain-containing protein [Streptomyces olivoverticillatus]MBB4891099.1 anti-anti-sigma regulatory factor [Streptomyces olivoverticillatus]